MASEQTVDKVCSVLAGAADLGQTGLRREPSGSHLHPDPPDVSGGSLRSLWLQKCLLFLLRLPKVFVFSCRFQGDQSVNKTWGALAVRNALRAKRQLQMNPHRCVFIYSAGMKPHLSLDASLDEQQIGVSMMLFVWPLVSALESCD